jgi:hypothetical protein
MSIKSLESLETWCKSINKTIKQSLFSLFFLLTSCTLITPNFLSERNPLSIAAFEAGKECPHVCWLGIQPEITSADNAISILMASNQINHEKLFQRSDTELLTQWYTDETKTFYSDVWLMFEGKLVKSITFNLLTPYNMNYFISLFGAPDTIIIDLDQTIDGGNLVNYAVYFSQDKVSLSVYPGSWDGPNPEDPIRGMTINSEFTYSIFLKKVKQQPWQGYGHLKDYLPGQEIPFGSYGGSLP